MTEFNLYKILKEELLNGSSDLVTRQSGHIIRERIEREISSLPEGSVIALDFTEVGVIDYSCADEIVAKLVSRLVGNEYGDRYIMLRGLSENQRENIEVALERKGLAALAELREGYKVILGTLNNYLKETLEFVMSHNKASAKDLSETMHIEANTSGTRLLNLYKKRLVRRTEEIRNGGRIWIYEVL